MKRIVSLIVVAVAFLIVACDALSTQPGSFVVVFQWETGHEPDTEAKDYYLWAYYQEWKGGEGKEFPADIEANAKSLNETGPVKLASGATLDFSELTYGDNRFVRAAIWDNEQRTGDPLYIGISELFDFKATDRNKVVAVNMKLQANAGIDETGEGGSFAIEIRQDGAPVERVPVTTVTLRFTIKNADTVVIANDLTFEKGLATLKLADLIQIDETTYEYGPWDITTGWEGLGDTTYSVFGKSRNTLGYESDPKKAEVFLDTTAPVPSITPFPAVAKLGDTVEVRFSFDEEVLPEALELNWRWLEFTLIENKANKSYTFSHTVTVDDPESTADFTLRATDLVGNATDHLPLGAVTIDRTAPWVEGAVIDATDDKEALKSGDVLTVSFTASEELSADPLLKIDDRTLTLDTKDEEERTYTYSYTVADNDISGFKTITASLRDPAGNDATVGLGFAIFDLTAPTLMGIAVSPGGAPGRAGTGGKISVVFTASEPLTTVTFDNDGLSFDHAVSIDGLTHTYTYGVTPTDDERTYDFSVSGYDAAGNELTTMPLGSVEIDVTPPDISAYDLSHTHVRLGEQFTLSFTASDPLGSAPVVLVGAKNISAECTADDLVYTCTHTAAADEGDGVKQIALQLADIAGNNTNLTLKDTADQYVTINYDVTAPDIVNPVIAPEKANLGATVDVRFSFTEDVAGVVIDWGALDGLFTRDPSNEGNTRLFIYKRQIADTDPEGEFPITVTAATDLAGNPITTAIPIGSLEIDRTAPEAKFPSVAVNDDTGKTLAKEGDTITVSFIVEEDIQEYKVRIGLIAVSACTFDDDDQRYTCTHTVQGSDSEGMKDVTVELKDLAGNAETYPLGQVSFDMTEAELANAIILPIKSNKATVKTEVKFSFTEEVVMTALADGGLGLSGADCPLNGDPRRDFICEYAFAIDDTQVHDYPVTVSATDRAGNPSIDLVVGTVSVDRDIPSLLAQDVDPTTLKLGDQFTISFTSSETLEGDPIVKVGALQLGAPTTHEGDDYTYTHIAGAGEGDGDKLISVTLTDPAGNGRTIDLAKTVTYDTTAPTVLNPTVSPETANLQAEAIDVRFSFPEDVEAVTLTGIKLSGDAGAPGSAPFICIEQGSAKSWRCAVSLIGIPWDIAEYELWVNGRDLAGNYINPADETNGQELGLNAVIDRKRPVISGEVVTQCTGTNCAVPKSQSRIGDVVRVSFEIDETPPNDPIVAIAGRLATACSGTKTYNYCILVQSDDGDGEKDIRIETADDAGNITIKTLAVKPLFDVTAPKVTNPVISPNPAAATSVVSLSFSFSEPIPVARMSVTSTSGQATPFSCSSSDDISYLCTRAVAPADGDGYSIVVNATDAAGNPLSDYPAGTLSIDRDMPGVVLTQATPTTINLSVNTLTIQFEVNETPAADPILRIGADTITTIPVVEDITPGKRYTYTIPIAHTESEGIKKATAEVYDAAGNHYYAELTYALGGSPDLIYDFTVPRVITRNASPERANVTTQGIQVLTSFSEPVQKPATGTLQVQKRVGANWVTQSGMASRVSVEDRPVGYSHALYFSLLDMMITNDGEYRIHMQVTDENGNTAVTQGGDLLNLGEFRIDMTLPRVDATASVAAICTEPTDLNPGETDYCTRPGHVDKAKARSGDTIYYKLVFDRSDPYYEFDDIVNVWPTIEVSGLGAMSNLSQITFPGDAAPYTFLYRYKVSGSDTEDVSSYALVSMEDNAGNTYRKLSDDLVRTDVTKPTLVTATATPAYAKVGSEIVVVFTLSEPVASVSFNGAGLAFVGGCTTTDNISYRCAHTVASGDAEGTKNFTATATDPTGNTSVSFALGSTVIDKTLPTPNVTSFVITTNSGFQLPNGTHAVANGHIVSVETVFTTVETLGKTPIVQIGGTDMTSVACAVPATNKYCFRRTVSSTEGAGLKPLALITEDRAGNINTATGASWQVVYDFSAPRIVSALLERTPNFAPARDSANQIQYYSIRDPYTNALVVASLTVYADEEVAAGPVLNGFDLGAATVSTDEVYYSRTLSDADAAGTYDLTISWSDRLGNSTTLGIPWRMAIDKTAPSTTRVSMDKFLYTRIPYGSNATAGLPRYNASATEGAITYLSGDSFKGDIQKVFVYNDNDQYVAQGDVTYDVAGLVSQPIDIQNMPAGNTLYIRAGFLDRAGNISSLSTVRFVEWIATMGGKVAGSSFGNPLSYYKMNNFSRRTAVDPDYQIEDPGADSNLSRLDDSASGTTVAPEWYEYLGNGAYLPGGTTSRRSMVFDPVRGTFLSVGSSYTDAGTLYEFDPATNTWRTINVDGIKPTPYEGAPIAYDTTRNKLFLFGGGTGSGAGNGDDLWEFDPEQRRWTLIDPDPRIGSPREFGSMIYDPKRQRLILFGGSDGFGGGDFNETWIYYINGTEWENVTDQYEPTNNPSARSATAMAYDPENDTVILFGGCYFDMEIYCYDDTWELNPQTLKWTELAPGGAYLGIRGWHRMAYDEVREKILLYGGYDDDAGTYYSQLYQYDRRLNTWVAVTTSGATPTTSGAFGMAYDTIRDKTVIWSGLDTSGNDTDNLYEFDGLTSRWTDLTTRIPTSNVWSSDRMIFNANRGRYLLYMANTGSHDAVWEFDPNERRWTQMTVSSGPTLKYLSSYGIVHEPTGSYRTMLWGGSSNKKMYYWTPGAGDTGTWTDVTQVGTLPTAYYEMAMAYDSLNNWAVLFGGRVGGTYYNGTFIYRVSDARWFDMTSSDTTPPTARIAAAMVYDPDNARMIMFGGRASGGSALNEMWQFNMGTYQWTTVTPVGSPPPARYNHSMAYDASRKKIILYGGRTSNSDSSVLEDLWEYDIAGNRWTRIYFATGRGPGTLDDYAMAIDPTAGRVLMYDNLTNRTYALYTVVNETPAHLLKVPLRYAYGTYYASLYDLRVDVYAGASVNSGTGGALKYGAMLDVWYGGRWLNAASNTADFETYAPLSFSVTDQRALSRMPTGETDTLQFAIRAKGPQGTGSTGELAVDYAEVRVKYDLYGSPPAPVSEYFVGTTARTWENARLDCRSRGMDLVTVDSWTEYNNIKALVGTTNSYWIGYHDVYLDGEWRWVGGDAGWKGAAGGHAVNYVYNQWYTGHPISSGTDNCASFHKTNNLGNWLSSPCSSSFLYVCERHPGEKRYYASTSTATWATASTTCTNAGGALISINSGLEQKMIERLISRYQNYWIGLHDTGSNYWYWSDGTLASRGLGAATVPYGYTNWITYSTARPVNSNYYGLINGPLGSLYTDYKWSDASGASSYYYICEF